MFQIATILIGTFVICAIIIQRFFNHTITFKELLVQLGVMIGVLSLIYTLMGVFALNDTMYVNGKILSKHRDHGYYTTTHSCGKNCTTTTKHYTVKWFVKTTVGTIGLSSAESTSSVVYLRSNPKIYDDVVIGEFATTTKTFKNYVAKSKKSLFHKTKSKDSIVAAIKYPAIHDKYKLNHVVDLTGKVDTTSLNNSINEVLKESYPFNFIVFIVSNRISIAKDLENSWQGGKLNDMVLVLYVDDSNVVTNLDGFMYGNSFGNEYIIPMYRSILNLRTPELNRVETYAVDHLMDVKEKYKQVDVKEFVHLKDDIEYSIGMMLSLILIGACVTIGLSIYFHKNEVI